MLMPLCCKPLLLRGAVGISPGGAGRTVWDFKGCNFNGAVLLWAARWCCRCEMSYRDLEPA